MLWFISIFIISQIISHIFLQLESTRFQMPLPLPESNRCLSRFQNYYRCLSRVFISRLWLPRGRRSTITDLDLLSQPKPKVASSKALTASHWRTALLQHNTRVWRIQVRFTFASGAKYMKWSWDINLPTKHIKDKTLFSIYNAAGPASGPFTGIVS